MQQDTEVYSHKIKTIEREIADLDQQRDTIFREYIHSKNRLNRIEALIDIKRRQMFSLKKGLNQ